MNELTKGLGYIIKERIIPNASIDSIVAKLKDLHPVRASSHNKVYAERDRIKTLPNIAVWWSQTVMDWPEVLEIEKIINPFIIKQMPNAKFYASDIVTIEAGSKWINPHVDTPHRFAQWNFNQNLLGIQCIVSLTDLDKDTGVTGIVPNSYDTDFEINMCYKGYYDQYFLKNMEQHSMPKGSVLFYNCRMLHSSMPNPSQQNRPALLLNYLDSSILEEVTKIDNVWTSNGK